MSRGECVKGGRACSESSGGGVVGADIGSNSSNSFGMGGSGKRVARGGSGGKYDGGMGGGGRWSGKVKIWDFEGGGGGRDMYFHVSRWGTVGRRLGDDKDDDRVGRRVGDLYGGDLGGGDLGEVGRGGNDLGEVG